MQRWWIIVTHSPGGVLVEELPPLALVRLLDRDPHRRLPHALPGGQVGEHVLLQNHAFR